MGKQNRRKNKQSGPELPADEKARVASATHVDTPTRSAEALLHELHVHQIELEMQNEELRRVQIELEAARDRYRDLYDFAPVGYLTLTREGLITEINRAGATMLGEEPMRL